MRRHPDGEHQVEPDPHCESLGDFGVRSLWLLRRLKPDVCRRYRQGGRRKAPGRPSPRGPLLSHSSTARPASGLPVLRLAVPRAVWTGGACRPRPNEGNGQRSAVSNDRAAELMQ